MATVRQMAERLAGQGVTRERFVELMSSFGIDPLDPASQDIEVSNQFASAPLLPNEGPQRGAPLTFDQPAAFDFQQQAPVAPQPAPMQQRPLPYATDVQRPDLDPQGQAFIRNQPTERMPSGIADVMQQRPGTASSFDAAARTAGEMVDYLGRPDELPGLQAELDLQRGLNPYQKAGLEFPKVLGGRAVAAATRLGVFLKESSDWIGDKALEGISAVAPEKWASDEDMYIPAVGPAGFITLTPAQRRELDRKFEQQDLNSAESMETVLGDALSRNNKSDFIERAVDNTYEFVETTLEFINWMTGGDIPKEYWQIASGGEVKSVLDGINEVLVDEAEERLPQMGNDVVGFTKALLTKPGDVSSAYPVATAFLLYPLARQGWVKMSPKATQAARSIYESTANVPAVGAVADAVNQLVNGFQRWKVDPSKMADPAMNKLGRELLQGAPKAEAAVQAMGAQLSESLGPRIKRPAQPRLDPDAPMPESSRFMFRDSPEQVQPPVPVEPVQPIALGPAVAGAETFTLLPQQRMATPLVGAELSRIMQSSPEMAEMVAALIRRGVTAEEVVAIASRSRDPSRVRPVAMEVQRTPDGIMRSTDMPEVLPEVASTRAAMQARRQPAVPESTPVQPGLEMALRQPDPPQLGPGVEMVPPRPVPPQFTPPTEPIRIGGRPYERPSLEPGLDPPRASRGFEYEQRPFVLEADGKVSAGPVEGVRQVQKQPVTQPVNERAFRIIEDTAEALPEIPGLRRAMYEEYQAALTDFIANTLQVSARRNALATELTNFLKKETRGPVDRRSILAQLEAAADSPTGIYDPVFSYKQWQSGQNKSVSAVDFGTPKLRANKALLQEVNKTMAEANYMRLGTRVRKLSHQNDIGKTLASLHPDEAIRSSANAVEAARRLPTPAEEASFLVREYAQNGRLPEIVRNVPDEIIAAAPDMPQALKRRVKEGFLGMREVPKEIMQEVLGLEAGLPRAAGRQVRIDNLPMANVGFEGPRLWMKADLLGSLRYVSKDRGWVSDTGGMLPTGVDNFFRGLARVVKKGGVALNPSSHAAAWLSNTVAAALKYGNPLAWVDAVRWGADYARWRKSSKAFADKPANPLYTIDEVMRATTRGDILDSTFTKVEIPDKAVTVKAVDSFVTQARKRMTSALGFNPIARLFDVPDNIFKGWATMKGVNKYVEEWQMLPEGKSFTLPLSRGVEKRAYKRASNKPNMSDMVIDGKQLTRAQMLQELTRSSAFEAAQTFVNFNQMPLLQVAGRSTPLWDAIAKAPWSGWRAATSTVPGRQGIVGEILSGPARRSTTDYLPLMLKRNAEAAAHGYAVSSAIGSQSAKMDETSSLFRLAKAFSTDDVKPIIAKPTGEGGSYSVWDVGNASPIEDLVSTMRWMEGARSMFSKGMEKVDPTELSYLTEQEIEEMFKLSKKEMKDLTPYDIGRLKAAKGLSDATSKGYGFSERNLMDSIFLGSSALGEGIVALTTGRGYKAGGRQLRVGTGEWDGVAKALKWSQRTYLPRVLGKAISAQAEVLSKEKQRLLKGLAKDQSLSDGERRELMRETKSDIDYLDFISGAQYRPPEPPSEVERKAKDQLQDVILSHLFNLPRIELALGEGSVTEKFLNKKLKRTVKEVALAPLRREIEYFGKLASDATDPRERAIFAGHQGALERELEALDVNLKEEIDARVDMLTKQIEAAQRARKNRFEMIERSK